MVIGNLPDGWEWKRVGDIVTFEYGKGLTQNKRDSSGKVPVYGSNGIVGYHSSALVNKPCLIIGRKGAAGAVHKSMVPCWAIDTTYYTIPPANANLSFLYYLFSSLDFPSLDRSTAIPGLNRNDAYAVEIPFPPLPEQERIVSRIEELFSDLEAGVAALERVRTGLRRYKASVLKEACEGKLVPQDLSEGTAERLLQDILVERKRRQAKYKQPLQVDFSDLKYVPSLPQSWMWVTLDQLTWSVKDGPHYSPKYVEEGIPFITGGNVRPSGVDFEKAKRISPDLYAEFSKRVKPEKGDILYTKGGTTGIARVNTYDVDFSVWVHVAVLKLSAPINAHYLQHALNSEFCYNQSQKYTHGVGNQDLGLTRMIKIVIPLPPLAEQQRIVAEVERRLSVAGEVESAVAAGLVRAGRLRQAVLRSAFEGRLT